MTSSSCGSCGGGARDAAFVCDRCADAFTVALREVGWLEEQLDISLSGQQGVDYRRASSSGATKPAAAPLPLNLEVGDVTARLRAALTRTVRYCLSTGVRNASPHPGGPAGDPAMLVALAGWLQWRVDGLALDAYGPIAVAEVTLAVKHGRDVLDRHGERQYLGPCNAQDCDGKLYARGGSKWARCDRCGVATDAGQLRDRLLGELDDRLCSASEIARLSTYLGLRADRAKVRNKINVWHRRGRIVSESLFEDDPAFRFGVVFRLLAASESP